MNLVSVFACGLLSAAAIGALPSLAAAASREVLCESKHGRHAYCPTGPHGSVRVMEIFGRSRCDEGGTWGTDGGGIWVDQGCYARFWVEDPSSSHSNRNRNIAAGALGAAAIAAIIASSKHDRETAAPYYAPTQPPPQSYYGSGMVGRFRGYDSLHQADINIDIDPAGRVQYYALGQHVAGSLRGDRIVYRNGTTYRVESTPSGFVLRQDGDPSNVVSFQRIQ
jgi:hypothetical protein